MSAVLYSSILPEVRPYAMHRTVRVAYVLFGILTMMLASYIIFQPSQ